jgi:hypothetical protein
MYIAVVVGKLKGTDNQKASTKKKDAKKGQSKKRKSRDDLIAGS